MNIDKKSNHFELHLIMPVATDLNCDMGEGFPSDAAIMPFISSANIACGAHAGNPETMLQTVSLAIKHGVAIGAHPGYADPENFGRVDMNLSTSDITSLVAMQIRLLHEICETAGTTLRHVKPHGALYNLSARDRSVADAISRAIQETNPKLLLFGLSGSCSADSAEAHGIRFVHEVFADRTYSDAGTLTPRSMPNALHETTAAALQQVNRMLLEGKVVSTTGKVLNIHADTICIHGDGAHAESFAKAISSHLLQNNITLKSPQ
jgi:UPF0271 protein